MTSLTGSRSSASLSPIGPCRLPAAPGHGVLLPAGGVHQRGTPTHWLRHSGHDLLCIRFDRQGFGEDALRHMRELLPSHRASQFGGGFGGSWQRSSRKRRTRWPWGRRWRRCRRRWTGRQAIIGLQAGVLAQEHGTQLGFGI